MAAPAVTLLVSFFAGVCLQHGVNAKRETNLTRGSEHALLQRRLYRSLTPKPEACSTMLEGDACYDDVLWAIVHGIYDYPELYPAPLSSASRFEDFQAFLHKKYPDRCPPPCATADSGSTGERCVSRAVKLDFFNSTVTHRNLGGKGPDSGAENMRYSHVGQRIVHDGKVVRTFDLVVTATGAYQYKNQKHNGLRGSYGTVNLASPSTADLTFSFEDTATGAPVVLEAFHFSFMDIDQGKAHERMVVDGYEWYKTDPQTEVRVKEVAGGKTLFESTKIGHLCDNPRDPLGLTEVTCRGQTVDQKKRAVTFLFANKSSFNVKLQTTCRKRSKRGCSGRNFLFAGSSSLSYTCEEMVKPGLCAAFGDPHFVTFDGAHTVLLSHQPLWLVRSEEVWIQALSRDGDGKTEGFAVGGPFMKGHKLLVRKTGPWKLEASFDNNAILSQPIDEFHMDGVIHGHRTSTWNATLHSTDILAVRTQIRFRVGPWPERFMKPVGGLYLFKLPKGVEVTISGSDFMSIVITMPPQAGGQAGYCGNFNGDVGDDFEHTRPSFHQPVGDYLGPVDQSEALFNLSSWAGPSSSVPQLDPESVMRDCSQPLLQMATTRCRQVTNVRMREDCIFDVCATGLISAAEGVLAAEILENKVNARGIPLLMGEGQCLDVIGQSYTAYNTMLTTETDCKDVMRSLVLTSGVIGAQLQRNPTGVCQILVDSGTDPTGVQIRGGWSPGANTPALGHGIISNVTGEAGWSCWQVV